MQGSARAFAAVCRDGERPVVWGHVCSGGWWPEGMKLKSKAGGMVEGVWLLFWVFFF